MPIIKSAKKKLRKDVRLTAFNKSRKELVKTAIKKASQSKTTADIRKAISLVNRLAKRNLIHKNKASRITSRLDKLSKPKKSPTPSSGKKARV